MKVLVVTIVVVAIAVSSAFLIPRDETDDYKCSYPGNFTANDCTWYWNCKRNSTGQLLPYYTACDDGLTYCNSAKCCCDTPEGECATPEPDLETTTTTTEPTTTTSTTTTTTPEPTTTTTTTEKPTTTSTTTTTTSTTTTTTEKPTTTTTTTEKPTTTSTTTTTTPVPTTSTTTEETTTISQIGWNDECGTYSCYSDYKINQKVPCANDCGKFIMCQKNEDQSDFLATVMPCSTGLMYCQSSGTCEYSYSYNSCENTCNQQSKSFLGKFFHSPL